jgi:hypothetical protein
VVHPHRGQLVAEGAAGELGEDALELAARRGDLVGDVPEGEVRIGVALLDRQRRVDEEIGAVHGSRRPLPWPRRGGARAGRAGRPPRRQVVDALAVAEQLEAPGEARPVQRPAHGRLETDHDELVLPGAQAPHSC